MKPLWNLRGTSLLLAGLCLVAPALPAAAQEVITENLIVQAKVCAGVDCASNEAFGVDIVKLKHNNTRLLFDDSSTSVGFPATDWRLTANDATTGGVNRFSLEDVTAGTVPLTIRGAAPNDSFFVSNLGRVGLGTATPDARLDIEAASAPDLRLTDTGGTSWRLLNDSLGFSVITVGEPFRAVVVDIDGNMTINGILNQGSSRAIKTNIVSLDPRAALERVADLPVSLWSYTADQDGTRHLGPMAEDFHEAFGLGSDAKHIAPGDQAGVALLALQGLNQVVEEKDRQIADLAARIEALEKRLDSADNQ